ncbi:hypothetical protein GCM10011581_31940 [Saccharopolyspora subtropica]|uniref:Uncharacterized protein n=1 Tax=Saccharopolyspora thermophila TaxID=89367 RepID=A0A917JZU2_9PSEU|nr:hypothetical protein [Saccharopolyspora subtropica]GGI92387.1 hypothetical protein GCM10011581_31940 [Saccharopolyspora subtropica]
MPSGDDMDRAIRALETGAALPADSAGLLADLLEAHTTVEVGSNPPKGWLITDMASLDVARCILGESGSALEDLKKAVAALREGQAFPQESSPVLAALLNKHRQLEWPAEPSEGWLAVRDAAHAVAAAVVRGMM